MRIVCQKCASAYAIDDKFVTEKGVRAQCPKCRHLQMVKRGMPDLGETPQLGGIEQRNAGPQNQAPSHSAHLSPPSNRQRPPPSAPPPSRPGGAGASGAAQTVPVRASSPRVSESPLPPASSPKAVPSRPDRSPFDFDTKPGLGPRSSPTPAPQGSAFERGAPSPFDFTFGAPVRPTGASEPPRNPFDFDLLAKPAVVNSGLPLPSLGPANLDPPNLGTKDGDSVSRQKLAGTESAQPQPVGTAFEAASPTAPGVDEVPDFAFDLGPPPPAPVATEAQAVASRCKSCGKALVDPFDVALGSCDECRATQNDALQTRKVEEEVQNKPAIEPPPVFVKPSPAPAKPPTTAPVIPPPSVPIGAPRDGVRTAHRESLPNTRTRVAAVVLAAFVLVGVIGVALYIKRPWVRRPPRVATTAAAPNAKSVDAILEQWKLKHADLAQEGASSKKKFLEEGETELAKDTPEGYRRAEAAFEKALVLDNSSDRALAGWVFAVAFGRGAGLDDPTSKAAESLLVAAEQRSGAPVLYVAHAHLDIVKGAAPNDVQHRAEIGKNSSAPRDKALASLAFGYSQLSRNVQVAEQSFREALEMEPSVKRTYFFQANLAMSQGRYQQATELLTKRLSLDPDQWDATELLAKLLVEFGDLAGAKKRIDEAVVVAPKSPRPRMGQAVFAYQHGSELNRAVEVLSALGADAALTPKERADALGHLAAALRVQGELDRARLAAEQAVELQPDHRPARVQQVLILCDKGVVSQARLVFDALAEDLSSPLRAQLEGRLFFAEGRFQESQSVLTALADKERSQVGALMLAGAAAAKARKDGKAWELCLKRALVADPFSNPLGPLTSYFVRQADLLRPALGAWAALSKSNNEDPNPHLCEGLAAWHSEDALSADRSFARVTAIDPRGSDAHAFRSLIALRRKETGAALIQANRAVGANRQNPLGHLALSLALLASNKPDAAKVAATQANKFGAALLAPRVVMGEVEARQNNKLEARRLLTGVLLADPWYRDAKRSLFRQGL